MRERQALRRSLRRVASILLLTLAASAPALPAQAATGLRVAAASSLQEALAELADAFQRREGVSVSASFGSSARLYQQIRRGAPYDLFFSADDVFPAKLEREGKGYARRRFAEGRLVLWAPMRSPVDPGQGLEGLRDPQVRKVAIANPRFAPYGLAAQEAIRSAGLEASLASRLVYGESAAQAAHFAATGAAEAGILPLSLAKSPKLASLGRYALLPPALHGPLPAEALLLVGARESRVAEDFLAFCMSPPGQEILRRFGLDRAP